MKNKFTQEYINYYLGLKKEPQYAIILKGSWGAGKTWFIDRVLKEYNDVHAGFKFLKVSLYGINSVEQIEDEFFRQLHPVLSNKAFIFGANVIKNTLKASLKIDINGDGKSDLDINTSVPTINLSDLSREPEGFVLVFDDIERTGIELPLLFGYINHFVEVNGYKAILIANEDEILNRELSGNVNEGKSNADYLRKKEKLVGRTFEIESDLHSACGSFLSELSSLSVAKIFKDDMSSIESLYQVANYNNLRHLRQFFLDVERITNLLGAKYIQDDEFMRFFCHQLLIFSIEYRGGNLRNEEFNSIGKVNYALVLGDKSAVTKYDTIVKKYSFPALSEKLLDGEVWKELICDGKITDNLRAQLNVTRFFRSNDAQAWEYLWNFRELSETELNKQYSIARDNLLSGKISFLGELLMIVSILLELANEGLTSDSVHVIIDEAKHQIDALYNKMSPEEIQKEYVSSYRNELISWNGMGFLDRDGIDFKVIRDHARVAKKNRFDASLPEFAIKFSEELKKGEFTFLSELSISNERELNLYGLPFLHLVDTNLFIDSYRQLDPVIMKKLAFSLQNRYSDEYTRTRLSEEFDWLKSLKNTAEKFIKNPVNTRFQVYHVKALVEYTLKEVIEFFNKGSDQLPSG